MMSFWCRSRVASPMVNTPVPAAVRIATPPLATDRIRRSVATTVLRSLNVVPTGRSSRARVPTVSRLFVRPSGTSTAATTEPLPRSLTPWTCAVPSRRSRKSKDGSSYAVSASPAIGGTSHWKPSSTMPGCPAGSSGSGPAGPNRPSTRIGWPTGRPPRNSPVKAPNRSTPFCACTCTWKPVSWSYAGASTAATPSCRLVSGPIVSSVYSSSESPGPRSVRPTATKTSFRNPASVTGSTSLEKNFFRTMIPRRRLSARIRSARRARARAPRVARPALTWPPGNSPRPGRATLALSALPNSISPTLTSVTTWRPG